MRPNRAALKIQRRQIDRKIAELRPMSCVESPATGWIRAVRESLGMTEAQLAKRAGIAVPTLHKLERSEPQGVVSIKTLRKLATALGCQLIYAIIPPQSLEETIDQQSLKIAKKISSRTSHTMALESQSISGNEEEVQVKELAKELKEKRPSSIWEEG